MPRLFAYVHRTFAPSEAAIRAADIVSPCEIYRDDVLLTKIADGLQILGMHPMTRYGLWYDTTTGLFRITTEFKPELKPL